MINDHQVSLLCYLDNQMFLTTRNFCQWDPQYVLLLKYAWQRILGVGLHSAVSFFLKLLLLLFFSSDVEHTQAYFLKWHKVKRDRIGVLRFPYSDTLIWLTVFFSSVKQWHNIPVTGLGCYVWALFDHNRNPERWWRPSPMFEAQHARTLASTFGPVAVQGHQISVEASYEVNINGVI